MVRSPSSNNVYRHHTPPKELFYNTNNGNNSNNSKNGNMEADSEFVVHRSKGITTLSNMQDPLIPAKLRQSKEKSNNDTKADERGELIVTFLVYGTSSLFLFSYVVPYNTEKNEYRSFTIFG